MTPTDTWAAGQAYEPFIGRWSRLVAAEFLPWLDVPPGAGWADVGCGTGAVAAQVLAHAVPRSVIGIDPAPGFVTHARERAADPRASWVVGDAQALPVPDAAVDAAIAALVLNFVPDPARAVREMARITRPGGTVAAYVWDYAEGMQLLRHFWDAAASLDPAAAALDEAVRFPLCRQGGLAAVFDDAGLTAVTDRPIEVPTRFSDFDDYWTPFLGGQGPAPTYCATLSAERLDRLRRLLQSTLPVAADGTISLLARAWAVRGRR